MTTRLIPALPLSAPKPAHQPSNPTATTPCPIGRNRGPKGMPAPLGGGTATQGRCGPGFKRQGCVLPWIHTQALPAQAIIWPVESGSLTTATPTPLLRRVAIHLADLIPGYAVDALVQSIF